ncbi:S1 family peptidase [Bacillus solimangrovi]|uniref:Serine protease n=1 Tax=Bacillus solimangrovi TaxID=1305675 RepID=A0A1E5LIZ5_9BACI|nr:serine protease [Bacillus solimangrovi]OEH94055.1 hypothetical protein BFG57_09405 [Bacillus solimangrovi]
MNDEKQRAIDRHIEDIKKYETELFSETEEIENSFENGYRIPSKTNEKPSSSSKLIISLIALFLFFSTAGTLLNFFNIPAFEFVPKSDQLSQKTLIQTSKEAVVLVNSENRKGTGFNISNDGLIVTNYHIVKESRESVIRFPDGKSFRGTTQETLPEKDIAILSIETQSPLPFLNVEWEKHWEADNSVYIIGNPLSYSHIASEGTVIGLSNNTSLDIPTLSIQTKIYSGNSGSPVINSDGKVIAVIYARSLDSEQPTAFAVPTYEFHDQVSGLLKKK